MALRALPRPCRHRTDAPLNAVCTGRYTPGQIQPLLSQLVIPLTMGFAFFMLRARFSPWELLGAVLMLAGAAVSVASAVTDKDDSTKW